MNPAIAGSACCCGGTPPPPCGTNRDVLLQFRFVRSRRIIEYPYWTLYEGGGPYPCPSGAGGMHCEDADFACLWEYSPYFGESGTITPVGYRKRTNTVADTALITVLLPYDRTESDLVYIDSWVANLGGALTASGFPFFASHVVDIAEGPWDMPEPKPDGTCAGCCSLDAEHSTTITLSAAYGFRATYSIPPYPFRFARIAAYPGLTWEVAGGHLIVRNGGGVAILDFDLSAYTLGSLRTAMDATAQLICEAIGIAPGYAFPATIIPPSAAAPIAQYLTSWTPLLLVAPGTVTEPYQDSQCGPYWDMPNPAEPTALRRFAFAGYSGTEDQFCRSLQCIEDDPAFLIDAPPLDGGWTASGTPTFPSGGGAVAGCPPVWIIPEDPCVPATTAAPLRMSPYGDHSQPASGIMQEHGTDPICFHVWGLSVFEGCPDFSGVACKEAYFSDAERVGKLFQCLKVIP